MSKTKIHSIFNCKSVFQHQALAEEGFEVREQVRQAAEEGRRVQLPEPVEDGEEEGVLNGRGGRRWGEFYS